MNLVLKMGVMPRTSRGEAIDDGIELSNKFGVSVTFKFGSETILIHPDSNPSDVLVTDDTNYPRRVTFRDGDKYVKARRHEHNEKEM